MSALRILHVAPYSPDAWAYGGIPRVVGAFTRSLAAGGHAVTVCATDVRSREARLDGPERAGRLRAWPPRGSGQVTTRIFPNVSNRLAYDWQFFTPIGLTRFLRRHARDFDVAHLHACRNLPISTAARHLGRAGIPFLMSPNGTAPLVERRRLAKRGFDLVMGDAPLRRAAAVLAVSTAERRQLLALGVPDNDIHLVPNPVDLDEFEDPVPAGRLRARVGCGDSPVVLYLGKLTPRKRVDLLVDAFARAGRSDALLVIAGNDMGSLVTIRAAVRRHRVDDRTFFTGLLEGRERLEALTDADVVVYPSDHEVFGLVPVEAMLCGTPVIVADDSGCGEIVGETGGGKVTPLGDVDALAAAIQSVLAAPDAWRERVAEASGRVRSTFGADRVTAGLARLYQTVCQRSSAERARPTVTASDRIEELS